MKVLTDNEEARVIAIGRALWRSLTDGERDRIEAGEGRLNSLTFVTEYVMDILGCRDAECDYARLMGMLDKIFK